jgi:long-chain fatty acid transport protein
MPASLSFSVAHTVDKFTWLADVTWTGWSSFDELRIDYDSAQLDTVTTEDWDDSMRYSVGFDYQYSDSLVLRAGLAIDETPIPSKELRTPRIPGEERFWVSVGLTYVAGDNFSFDVGYSHLTVDDPEIDNTFESPVSALNHTLTGEYEADVDILSAQLNWKID